MPSRDATTHWHGDLKTGSGTVTLDSSAAGSFPVSFPTRAGDPDGQTSPEELIAAAHSACYAMSLSNGLAEAGTPATALDVSAEVTLGRPEGGGLAITSVVLTVEGTVPGIDAAGFAEAANVAKAGCPVSRALAGVPSITVETTLLPA
jgi:osmotically inducible protein OsmC